MSGLTVTGIPWTTTGNGTKVTGLSRPMAGPDGSLLTMRADGTMTATGKANTAGLSTGTNGIDVESGIITNTRNTTAITIGPGIGTVVGTTITASDCRRSVSASAGQ